MAAKSKVSQPRFVDSWTPHQAWFSSVTDGNRGKADVVATSWQQAFTHSAFKKAIDKVRAKVGFKSTSKKAKLTHVFEKKSWTEDSLSSSSTVSVSFLLEVHLLSSVAVYRQAQLKEDLPQQERKNHNRLWRRKEIVRAALNKKKYC